MPEVHQDVEFNRRRWADEGSWKQKGEDWSEFWGSSEAEWYGAILPRLSPFLPAESILEIAPGYGRWTRFLLDWAKNMYLVDLAENCIEHCQRRFHDRRNIRYVVNDGSSLAMIPSESIDLIFSFDSLVHADIGVLETYFSQFSRILKTSGVALIHHSNSKSYSSYFEWTEKLPRGRGLLKRLGLLEMRHLRNLTVSCEDIVAICERLGLNVLVQEKISWGGKRLIDGITVIGRRIQNANVPTLLLTNPDFTQEASVTKAIWERYRSEWPDT